VSFDALGQNDTKDSANVADLTVEEVPFYE
jgi:hypothetical protein